LSGDTTITGIHSEDPTVHSNRDEDTETGYENDDGNAEDGEGEIPGVEDRPQHVSHGKKKIKPIPPENSMFIFSSTNRLAIFQH